MPDKDQRREQAKRDVEQRRNCEQQSERIRQKCGSAREACPDPDDINGPPWNKAVILYLEAIDERLGRIEDELGIEE